MALIDGLVSHWKLDGNGTDSHGSNTLTAQGSPAVVTGKLGDCYDFEATSNLTWLQAADHASLDITDDLTLMYWCRPESAAAQGYVVAKSTTTGNQRSYRSSLNTTPRFTFECSTDGTSAGITTVTSTTAITANGTTWYFVVCRASASQLSISVNAGTPQTAAYSGGIFSGSSTFRIGDLCNTLISSPGFLPFDGLVDEVSLFNVTKSDADITAFYNSGNALAYPWAQGAGPIFGGRAFGAGRTFSGILR